MSSGKRDKKKTITIGDTAQKIGGATVSGKGSQVVTAFADTASADTASASQASAAPSSPRSSAAYTADTGTAAGRAALRKSFYDAGDPLVAARDHTVGSGYSGAVSWDGENVTIGGTPIEPAYVIDGTAYVPRSEAEAAIKDMEERGGIIGAGGVEELWDERYGGMQDEALRDVMDREPFSYDPEEDPVYDAYRRMYLREADDALERILNENNTSVTGASGAVLSEALAARDRYLSSMTDMIPELAADAYERYTGENDRLIDRLGAAADRGDEYYDRLYERDRDAYTDLIEAGEREREERQRREENNRAEENDYYDNVLDMLDASLSEKELEYYDEFAEQELRGGELENSLAEQEYYANAADIAMSNAERRGFFTSEDEAGLPWLAAYRDGRGGYSLDPYAAEARREYEVQLARSRAQFEASLWGIM